jgi:UDP-N-acetylmuramyl pentapeptide phosphotransferase/UDP-N-acetylglucosamine-1-phosphate transferase
MTAALLAPVVAFAATVLLLRVLSGPAVARRLMDHPNQRSLHRSPTPRIGGLGAVPGLLAGGVVAGVNGLTLVLGAGLMILSLFDDWRSLPSGARLVGHLAAASVFVVATAPDLHWAQCVLLVVAIGWMTNLYNFMDGADGLAGGMAVFGFGTYAVAAWLADQPALAWGSAAVGAAGTAFLLFNFPPARIFLGDAGSIPLGFLAAALGLSGWMAGAWPLWFPPVVFAPFVVDASVTLVRRALRGEKIWQAHRSHYYQRLVLMGWTHRQLATLEYALMLLTGMVALWTLRVQPLEQMALVVTLGLVYLGIGTAIDLRWRARKEAKA